jgi:hypothetical protein
MLQTFWLFIQFSAGLYCTYRMMVMMQKSVERHFLHLCKYKKKVPKNKYLLKISIFEEKKDGFPSENGAQCSSVKFLSYPIHGIIA